VWDLADAHLRAISWHKGNPESAAVFNLGTQHGISNHEIVDYVVLNYGPVDILAGPRRPGDPDKLIASADYATEVLGWKTNYSTINQIIDSAYKWYTREL
jgi:UDP-glucose 4-epimerase